MCLSCTRTSADLFSTNISFLVVCSTTCMWGKLTVVRIEIMYCCNGVLMGNLGGTVYHEYKSQHPHTVTHTHTTNQLLESSSSLFAACQDSTVILCFEPHVSGAFPQFLFVWHMPKFWCIIGKTVKPRMLTIGYCSYPCALWTEVSVYCFLWSDWHKMIFSVNIPFYTIFMGVFVGGCSITHLTTRLLLYLCSLWPWWNERERERERERRASHRVVRSSINVVVSVRFKVLWSLLSVRFCGWKFALLILQ